jgi:hypothetical protein
LDDGHGLVDLLGHAGRMCGHHDQRVPGAHRHVCFDRERLGAGDGRHQPDDGEIVVGTGLRRYSAEPRALGIGEDVDLDRLGILVAEEAFRAAPAGRIEKDVGRREDLPVGKE